MKTAKQSMISLTKKLIRRWLEARKNQSPDHETARFLFLAWVGCIGMPLYYVLWTFSFPQKFESLELRAIGFGLCVLSVCSRRMFRGRLLRAFDFAAITYMLPFFFSYMFLMNHGSPAWSQSLIVALIVLFHFETSWALKSFCCGIAIAGVAFSITGDIGFLVSNTVLQQVPIVCFTVLVVSCAKIGRNAIEAEKLASVAQALATVAHEIRTPLISVAANVRGVERRLVSENFQSGPGLAEIGEAMNRIKFEVRHVNHMVDLFLMSSAAMNQKLEPCEEVGMRSVVDSVISRYPFTDQAQRDLVDIKMKTDFVFFGSHELGVVLLLNLLRNALRAIQRARKGGVRIVIDGQREKPRLMIIDTGCGIEAKLLPFIFEKFFTYPQGTGSGIGLALCKDIGDAWHTRIYCRSRESVFTVFILEFPPGGDAFVTRRKFIDQPRTSPCPCLSINTQA
jgi:two-component system CAI-1 autoinducer sensor kinase/phosphatase CqsS